MEPRTSAVLSSVSPGGAASGGQTATSPGSPGRPGVSSGSDHTGSPVAAGQGAGSCPEADQTCMPAAAAVKAGGGCQGGAPGTMGPPGSGRPSGGLTEPGEGLTDPGGGTVPGDKLGVPGGGLWRPDGGRSTEPGGETGNPGGGALRGADGVKPSGGAGQAGRVGSGGVGELIHAGGAGSGRVKPVQAGPSEP
ncbi:hypothetical protein ACLQ2R_23895 [Streptosporangium sp. DT93]|uniref:hypothetical protein n=1 Tax=Streptosporangium sp. DT93 TaxID=3393428 RepID=UPI003CF98AD4